MLTFQATTQEEISTSSSQEYEPFNVDDMGLNWMQDSYPMPQDVIDPTFSQLNIDSQNMFTFPEAAPTQGIISMLNYHPDPMVQHRKEVNLQRSLKTTSHMLLNSDDATFHPRPGDPLPTAWMVGNATPILESGSVGECVRKLSQLSSDLYEHSQTIPPLSIHDPNHPSQEKDFQNDPQYFLEETFRLTQGLVDIYPAFLNTFLGHTSAQISTPPFSSSDNSPESSTSDSPEIIGDASPPRRQRPPLDHSSILLILSCHIRIIEIYEGLFKHMEVCIKQKGTPLTRRQEMMKVPQLSIGTFVPPPSSAIPMQMLLLIQFSSQLFNYAAELASEIDTEVEGDQNGVQASPLEATTLALTRAAVANVKDRASFMTENLGTMRGMMLHSGLLA